MRHLFRPAMFILAGLLAAGGATTVLASSDGDIDVTPVEMAATDDDQARKEDAPGALLDIPADDDVDDDNSVDTQDDSVDTHPDVDSADSQDDSVDTTAAAPAPAPAQDEPESIDTQDDSVDTTAAAPAPAPAQDEPESIDTQDDSIDDEAESVDSDD